MTVDIHIIPDGYMVNGRMVTVLNGQIQNVNELDIIEEVYLKEFINRRNEGIKIIKTCATAK